MESRKAMDVVNIMQRLYGYECILCASKDHAFQLPLIYGRRIKRLRSSNYENFAADFRKLIQEYRDFQLVYLPVSEKPTKLLYRFLDKESISNLAFLLPREDYFNLCSDKFRFQQYCEGKGFPVPLSFTKASLSKLKTDFRPLILKPRSGQGSVGIRYLRRPEELEQLESFEWDDYLLQEKVESSRQVAGAFFLCKEGRVIQAYSHQRLRTFPSEGGVTVYSQSTCVPEIIEIGEKVLASMNWDGLAMIEFLYDESSRSWKIIELNPRIWGSVLLSAFNNSGMLDHYVSLSLGRKLERKKNLKNSYIRWLYPFDLLNWLKGKINSQEFFKFNLDNTCYINFTYSNWYRSLAYLLYFSINLSSIKRFLKKLN